MFTARYAVDPDITLIRFVLKGLSEGNSDSRNREHGTSSVFVGVAMNRWWNNSDRAGRQTYGKNIVRPEIT